jgi:hypothetical protein
VANFVYNEAKEELLKGSIDFSSDDIRFIFVMTNTTCDTENDGISTFADFTTIDDFDGTGYTAGGTALAGEAVTKDDANDRGEFDANDIELPTVGAGTRAIQALVILKFITNLNASMPLVYIDTSGFPHTPNGGDLKVAFNAEGILQAA